MKCPRLEHFQVPADIQTISVHSAVINPDQEKAVEALDYGGD